MMLTSVQNPRVKAVRALHGKKGRVAEWAFLLETTKLVEEARASGWPLVELYATPAWLERHPGLEGVTIVEVADHVLAQMVTTETAEGVVAIARMPDEPDLPAVTPTTCLVAADGLQDPGNLGTLIRTADAVAASGVLVGRGTVDPFGPKTVRATMGSLFHLPVWQREALYDDLAHLRRQGARVVATALGGAHSLWEADLRGPVVWLIGNESAGLSDEACALADEVVTIPMPGRSESLNAGIATAICLYETLRQRQAAQK